MMIPDVSPQLTRLGSVVAMCMIATSEAAKGSFSGSFECHCCGADFHWWVVPENRHVRGRCANPDCDASFLQ